VKLSLVALIVVGAFVSQRAAAQAVSPAGVVNRPIVEDTTRRFTKGDAFLIRSLTGTLGFAGGAAVGIGLALATGPHDCDGCETPGLGQTIAGVLVGGALGTSLGAAAPKLRGECSFGGRLFLSTVGSVVGGALGTVIGFNAGSEDAVLVGMPLGAVLGASTALIGC
jgi:hypothetical protein